MFDSLWNFIHNLFLSLMSDADLDAGRFIFVQNSFSPAWFYSRLCTKHRDSRIHCQEITWYKEEKGSRHEYLVARLQRKRGSKVMFARVERGPSILASWIQISSTSSPPSLAKEVSASDRITCLSQEASDRRIGNDAPLVTYAGSPGGNSLPDARMSSVPADPPKGAGYYTIIDTMTSQWTKDFDIIEQKYKDHRSANPDPIGPGRERTQREVQEARAEGLQEGTGRKPSENERRQRNENGKHERRGCRRGDREATERERAAAAE
ncbi:hypothetical protein JB92DRAFT_3095127 [Gautieria morchelliformis]|nr:hypothetical protein JB92DRAFT_3095127 [Gautieria morchelliformis]